MKNQNNLNQLKYDSIKTKYSIILIILIISIIFNLIFSIAILVDTRMYSQLNRKYHSLCIKYISLNNTISQYKNIITNYKYLSDNLSIYLEQFSKIYTIKRLSCYTPSKDECDSTPYITAINHKVIVGRTAAVSHDLLFMLGKRIYVYGYGVFDVTDVLNKRYKQSIDLCLSESKKVCKRFGTKHNVKVVVLYPISYTWSK